MEEEEEEEEEVARTRRRSRPSDAAKEDNDDHISALPNHIILHVLSFLDFRDIVRTSALSKRWSSVWTQSLAVSISFWTENSGYYDEFDFFEKLLLRCTSPVIRKFHLLYLRLNHGSGMKERVKQWIRFAVVRCVRDLRIHIGEGDDCDQEPYVLPWELLKCESLTRLRLASCEFPSLTNGNLEVINWGSLKTLTIDNTMMVDEVINGILERSPMLESLTLKDCYGMNNIRIFSKVMKDLVISRYFDHFLDDDTCYNLEIYAPYLRSLRLLGRWMGKDTIVLKDLLSLVDVELDFNLDVDFRRRNLYVLYGTMKGILRQLSFVDKLVIGQGIMTDICYYKQNGDFSLQLKCRHLTLRSNPHEFFLGVIAEVLECSPNVETLIIDFTKLSKLHQSTPSRAETFHNKFESWKRLTCCIKNIAITGFPVYNDDEPPYWQSLVKLLLRDAQMLDKMIINAVWHLWGLRLPSEEAYANYVFKVEEDILRFPRGSEAAQVMVKYPFKRAQSSDRLN